MNTLQYYQEQKQSLLIRAKSIDTVSTLMILAKFLAIAAFLPNFFFDIPQIQNWYFYAAIGIVFLAIIFSHEIILQQRKSLKNRIDYYNIGIDRCQGNWKGKGLVDTYQSVDHPFAEDLKIFGFGSLCDRVGLVCTSLGAMTLRNWILHRSALAEIVERQAAVQSLSQQHKLREDFYASGSNLKSCADPQWILEWIDRPVEFKVSLRIPLHILAASLSLGLIIACIGAVAWDLSPWLISIPSAGIVGLYSYSQKIVQRVEAYLSRLHHEIAAIVHVLKQSHSYRGHGAYLERMIDQLESDPGLRPEVSLKRMARLIQCFEMRRNQFFTPFAILTMWDLHFAIAIIAWRWRRAQALKEWLTTVGCIDALMGLATFSFENPDFSFPILIDSQTLNLEDLGHPLLEHRTSIKNHFTLDEERRFVLISGSNMAGKSTFLRAIGINTVLAYLGAPISASRATVGILDIVSNIQAKDDLELGLSKFMAEAKKIKAIVERGKQGPGLLFLIDEIFSGTNSKDRVAAAVGVLEMLSEMNCHGLLTTHDLSIVEYFEGRRHFWKAYFADTIHNGLLTFDYKLKPGIVSHSNALLLLETLGIKIERINEKM